MMDDLSWGFREVGAGRRLPPALRPPRRPARRRSCCTAGPGAGGISTACCERLEGDFEVIVPDLRGFGGSDRHDVDPRTFYSADAQASSVLGLLDELGVERVIVQRL